MDRDRKELQALAAADWDFRTDSGLGLALLCGKSCAKRRMTVDEAETKPYFELGRIGQGKFFSCRTALWRDLPRDAPIAGLCRRGTGVRSLGPQWASHGALLC